MKDPCPVCQHEYSRHAIGSAAIDCTDCPKEWKCFRMRQNDPQMVPLKRPEMSITEASGPCDICRAMDAMVISVPANGLAYLCANCLEHGDEAELAEAVRMRIVRSRNTHDADGAV